MQKPHDARWLDRWDEAREWEGIWWVASDTTRLGGTFVLDSFELNVLGGKLADMSNVPRIHGICSGIEVTLINCHHLRVDDRGMSIHGQSLSASLFLVGIHLGLDDALQFSQAQWGYSNLEAWAQRYPFDPHPAETSDTEVKRLPRQELSSRGGRLFLEQWGGTQGGLWTYKQVTQFGERFSLELPAKRPLHEIYWQWIVPTDRFLSLLMCRAGTYERLRVRREQDANWCDVHYARDINAMDSNPLSAHQVPIPFHVTRTSELLANWFHLHEAAAAICGTVLSPETLQLAPYARFMALASVAESLAYYLSPLSAEVKSAHKKRVGAILDSVEPSERKWLQEKIGSASRTFRSSLELLRDQPNLPRPWYCEEFFGWDWPAKFKDARNFYAHGSEKQLQLDEVHLDLMARCLDALIRSHLLQMIGLSQDELQAAVAAYPSIRDLLYTTVERLDES